MSQHEPLKSRAQFLIFKEIDILITALNNVISDKDIFMISKSLIYQLMHNRVALKEC
jgi:hypothetical protein